MIYSENEIEIEKMAKKICKSSSAGCNFPTCSKCGIKNTCKARIYATRAVNAGIGDKMQAAKSAVRDFITRLSYVRKSTVDDDGEPVVTVGVVNFDDMVDMFNVLYGGDKHE